MAIEAEIKDWRDLKGQPASDIQAALSSGKLDKHLNVLKQALVLIIGEVLVICMMPLYWLVVKIVNV